MKKSIILLPIFIALMALNTFAQEDQGITFGLRAGVNFQNINGKDASGSALENGLALGFHGGVNAEIPIATDFYFQPGLLFSTKGGQKKVTVLGVEFTNKANLSYLEVPLNLVYKPMLGNGNLILGFGPYVAYAIGGKSSYELGGVIVEDKIDFQSSVQTSDPNNLRFFKPFDSGANILFGYELSNGLSFQLNTQLGLVKINSENENASGDKSIAKNTGFGVSAGYRF